jgi:hypothetical protein
MQHFNDAKTLDGKNPQIRFKYSHLIEKNSGEMRFFFSISIKLSLSVEEIPMYFEDLPAAASTPLGLFAGQPTRHQDIFFFVKKMSSLQKDIKLYL